MGTITILNQSGDEPLNWDPADKASTKTARDRFNALKKDGYNFYAVDEVKGKRVEKFDPKAGRLIAAPGAQTAADKKAGTRQRAMAGGPVAETGFLR